MAGEEAINFWNPYAWNLV